jgi:hypothetical protein
MRIEVWKARVWESRLLIRNLDDFEKLDYGSDESGLVVRGMRVGFENHDYGSRNGFDNHRITWCLSGTRNLVTRITYVFCGFEKLGVESCLLIRNLEGFEKFDYGSDD